MPRHVFILRSEEPLITAPLGEGAGATTLPRASGEEGILAFDKEKAADHWGGYWLGERSVLAAFSFPFLSFVESIQGRDLHAVVHTG